MRKAPRIKPADQTSAQAAADRVVEIHRRLAAELRVGQTLAQIDQLVGRWLEELRCQSCFLGYMMGGRPPKFPSFACLSLNSCVVHGTAASHLEPMKPGDILSIDIGVRFEGWIGDAAWTYAFQQAAPTDARLMACGKECLRRGIDKMRAGNMLLEWARAVQEHAEGECGFHLIRGLGGHGYGKRLHEAPFVSNVMPTFPGEWPDAFSHFEPGMLLAVEPMVAVGTGQTRQRRGEWPVFTADGSISVHYEHDVLIDDHGPRVLTEALYDLPDIVG